MVMTADLETAPAHSDAKQPACVPSSDPNSPARMTRVRAEILDHAQVMAQTAAWQALIVRALEPNVFLEPGFLLPLLQNDKSYARLRFLAVWLETDATPQLIGLLPFFKPRLKYGALLHGATTAHSPLGTPLLDRDHAAIALKEISTGFKKHFPLAAALRLPFLPTMGAVFQATAAFAEGSNKDIACLDRFERAGLFGASEQEPAESLSAKRRKYYRQQRRRLEKLGQLSYVRTSDPKQIIAAAEEFLTLEAKGWKGRRHTAFLSSPQQAAFFRGMIENMAKAGKCRIDSLRLDDQPIAMGVVLRSGDGAAFWKTAFDERLSWLSPGVHLTLELTQSQLAEASIRVTDSCAVPDHPMINPLWHQRIAMGHVLLPLRSRAEAYFGQSAFLGTALFLASLQPRLRRMAKILLQKVMLRLAAKPAGNATSRSQTESE